jgi:uncharacterized protein YlxW (UPF0749 family)
LNPFANRIHTQHQQWILPVSAVCVVLGVMMSMAWVTKQNRSGRWSQFDPDQRIRVASSAIDPDTFDRLSKEVQSLRQAKSKLEDAIGKRSSETTVLKDQLDNAELLAGLTQLEGPGVQVTLKDSQKAPQSFGGIVAVTSDSIIHDIDVLKVVNELNASGAEAVSVNGRRVVSGTSFRCVGTTILVDGVRIASPVVIRAIGDSATLMGAMNLPGGVLGEIRESDPAMVEIEPLKKMNIPAYAGNTAKRFAVVPKESK